MSEAFLKACEQSTAERDHLRTVKSLDEEEKAAIREQVAAWKATAEAERARAVASTNADSKTLEALHLKEEQVKALEKTVAEIEKRLNTVEGQRDKAISNQKKVAIIGFILGILTGVFAAK